MQAVGCCTVGPPCTVYVYNATVDATANVGVGLVLSVNLQSSKPRVCEDTDTGLRSLESDLSVPVKIQGQTRRG
eukprot:350056-Chlamydomonas_euryale.AAC.1